MTESVTIARCEIEYRKDQPSGEGFYYEILFGDDTSNSPIGPFLTEKAAETAFNEALEGAIADFITKGLGL